MPRLRRRPKSGRRRALELLASCRDGKTIEVARVRISEAGPRALAS
jgi:hypothetical protein